MKIGGIEMKLFDLYDDMVINLSNVEVVKFNDKTKCMYFQMVSGDFIEVEKVSRAHFNSLSLISKNTPTSK